MKTVNIVTLGCSKNVVDSEHLMGQLRGQGWRVVFDSEQMSEVVIINTCGFILDAKQESIDTILSFVQARQRGEIEQLYVMGCLSERYADELRDELPEVDEFFGVNDPGLVLRALGAELRDDLLGARELTTPSHYAYLKISEGCNWGCGYCAIPLIRGRHVSVPMEQLVEEARVLAQAGVRELMVIAQDTTYYGMDLYGERRLGALLEALCAVPGIEWVRLHYAYPAQFPDDVIEVMATQDKMCKYLDIPFQHVSDRILSSMRRGLDKVQTMELIERLRTRVPDIALRTTLLVGYPGESEADFEELCDFVRQVRFDRLGVFPYSEEEGTFSALNLEDDVPQKVKEQRAERIMEIQRQISHESNDRLMGRVVRVIVDRVEGDQWVGRTQYDSPEVDNEVFIRSDRELEVGAMVNVEITQCDDYEVWGCVV